ncbi:probable WRKY transcription factor 53 [Salvia miltiorrhiza]|uniref:probable WRKY transcription factor 53 n=1 Tax=Salvia miltiorrhiza TaxID=226208 RepID=UPI0025AD031A|nr:probable WRKY transcription factor 53 [Salvia miltiorrhiza]
MERVSTWDLKVLTDELAQGMEKAMQLRFHLCSTSHSEAEDLILQRIISTFEKALCILKCGGHVGVAHVGAQAAAPESSISADGSSRSDDTNKNIKEYQEQGYASKKRKLQPTWTEQVKVNSENGLEGPGDDGYSWRKYGQKDILGAKYPRSYYRCTYRQGRNCWATKQVQRSDEDATVFEITYKGTHACKQFNNAVPPPTSPEKQELKSNNPCYDQLEQNPMLSNFRANLRVNTEVSDIQEMPAYFSFPSTFACYEKENHCYPISALVDDNHLQGTYSPLFYSPATSGSNCFSTATYQMRDHDYGGNDNTDIMSAHASTNNSPIGGMEFSIEPAEIDPNFPFNVPGFFT